MARQPKPGIRRLDKHRYVVLSTGEIKEYAQSSGKMREALRRTFQELGYLITTNFSGDDSGAKFITLTYAENMQDSDRLYNDFKIFMKRLQRYVGAQHQLEYIVVAEPQGRGAWHMHLMLKSHQPGLWIDKDKLEDIWGHGDPVKRNSTSIEQLKGDDRGRYYVAYFTNLTAEAKELTDAIANHESGNKAYIKGGRLQYYPKGFKFYRCSRGIQRPTREQIEYWRVTNDYGKPKSCKAYELLTETSDGSGNDERANLIQRETYHRS